MPDQHPFSPTGNPIPTSGPVSAETLEDAIRTRIGLAMRMAGYDTAGTIADGFFANLTATIAELARARGAV